MKQLAEHEWGLLTLCGVLMIVSALVGWAQFIPHVGKTSALYDGFISSPVGLGTGPIRIGGYLMIACGLLLLDRGIFLLRHDNLRNPLFWLVMLEGITITYVILSVATFFQIRPWTGTFASPSGRHLISVSATSGWGAGASALAMVLSIIATIVYYDEVRGVPGRLNRKDDDTTVI